MRQQVHSGPPFPHLLETLKIFDNIVTYYPEGMPKCYLWEGCHMLRSQTNILSFDMVFYKFFHSYLGKL